MTRASPTGAGALVVLALLVAGCRNGERTLAAAQLPNLVLQPADLPQTFTQFDEGAQASADAPQGTRADPARFGREGGWKARYRRSDNQDTSGVLVVESRVDLFEGQDGAEADLDAFRSDLGRARALSAPELGDAAAATTLRQTGIIDVRYYTVVWRYRNVTASVLVSGFEGRVALDDALTLAERQQRRIENAAAG